MKKYWHILALLAIIALAIVIRTYNFHDWLYFEADQVRNANNSIEAIEDGADKLPLLGPKAGGTRFHLGPASYWIEYLSASSLDSIEPEVFAYPNLLFLLLLIPLGYYFIRQFFSKNISLLVTAVSAFSYVITQYSRFSWNPNAIMFWALLFVLSIYKVGTLENRKKASLWLLLAALSFGIASQLHALALFGFPLLAIVFWIFYRPRAINWKYWLGAILIVLALYAPVIYSDIQTGGENVKEFAKAFTVKGEKRELGESFGETLNLHGKYYSLMIFSINDKEFDGAIWFGYAFLIFSLAAGILLFFKIVKSKKQDNLSRSFFLLVLSWFGVYALLYWKLAFDVDQPRFWFPVLFLAYNLLAILVYFLWDSKWGRILAISICVGTVFLNLTAIGNWYGEMQYQDGKERLGRKISSTSLIQNDFIGYGQIEKAVGWMKEQSENSLSSACFNTPSTYLASYKFVFDQKYPDFDARRVNSTIEMGLTGSCDVFIVDHSGNSEVEIIQKYADKGIGIQLGDNEQFGLVTVWKVLAVN